MRLGTESIRRRGCPHRAQYRTSDNYTSTKPKFTDRKGRKREYCDSGWSNEGIDFYNGV